MQIAIPIFTLTIEDLDSQDIDRVMAAVKRLLRICNHADFRENMQKDFQINLEPIEMSKYPKLVQSAITEFQTSWFENVRQNALWGLSWVVEYQNTILEQQYMDNIQKTQNLLISIPNFGQIPAKNGEKCETSVPKILKIQAATDSSAENSQNSGMLYVKIFDVGLKGIHIASFKKMKNAQNRFAVVTKCTSNQIMEKYSRLLIFKYFSELSEKIM